MKPFNGDEILRGAWRRAFARFPIVKEKLDEGKRYVDKFNKGGEKAKKQAVEFHCEVGDHWVRASLNAKRNIFIDHIVPVVDVANIEGGTHDWNEFHDRLVCSKENLQRICREHHNFKTQQERQQRTINKYSKQLDTIEQEINEKDHEDIDFIVKELKKLKTKKKPEVIKQRAIKLLEKVLKVN